MEIKWKANNAETKGETRNERGGEAPCKIINQKERDDDLLFYPRSFLVSYLRLAYFSVSILNWPKETNGKLSETKEK